MKRNFIHASDLCRLRRSPELRSVIVFPRTTSLLRWHLESFACCFTASSMIIVKTKVYGALHHGGRIITCSQLPDCLWRVESGAGRFGSGQHRTETQISRPSPISIDVLSRYKAEHFSCRNTPFSSLIRFQKVDPKTPRPSSSTQASNPALRHNGWRRIPPYGAAYFQAELRCRYYRS